MYGDSYNWADPCGDFETMCIRSLGGISAFEGHEATADPVPTQCVSCHLALELFCCMVDPEIPTREEQLMLPCW